jgi:hypothetical protein
VLVDARLTSGSASRIAQSAGHATVRSTAAHTPHLHGGQRAAHDLNDLQSDRRRQHTCAKRTAHYRCARSHLGRQVRGEQRIGAAQDEGIDSLGELDCTLRAAHSRRLGRVRLASCQNGQLVPGRMGGLRQARLAVKQTATLYALFVELGVRAQHSL